jgi:Zn-dependent membrane protease YugP
MHLQNGMRRWDCREMLITASGMYVLFRHWSQLTDHYNPVDKTVNLSESVLQSAYAAAAAVAHECGHAIQRSGISMVVNAF